MKTVSLVAVLFCPLLVSAQLAVTVLPTKTVGQKALVPLAMRNGFTEKVESARAVVFLFDEQGNMVGQGTQWVIGGTQDKPGLSARSTNTFHFVVTGTGPFVSTNLTAQVTFSRVILEGGKLVDVNKSVIVKPAEK